MGQSLLASEDISDEAFIRYHEELILKCKRNRFDVRNGTQLDELELLADLQHHRAATCLIDFTRNALVALWFACEDSTKDGKVFIVDTADPMQFLEVAPKDIGGNAIAEILNFETRQGAKDMGDASEKVDVEEGAGSRPKFWRWAPSSLNERIPAQHSLFIFGPISSGGLRTEEIIVDADSKSQIREELSDVHNINEETLFPDFVGFAYTQRYDAGYGASLDEYLRLGMQATQRGEYSQAMRYFSNASKIDPKDSWEYIKRGSAFNFLRENDNAIDDLNISLQLDRNNPAAYLARGLAFRHRGDNDRAIQDFNRVIELDENAAQAFRVRGWAYVEKGDYDSAIEDFSKSIEFDRNYARGYKLRGQAYGKRGDYGRAIEDFSEAIELDKNDTEVYRFRGEAYRSLGNHESAVRDFSKVIELDTGDVRVLGLRGLSLIAQGNHESAVQDFSKVIEIDRNDNVAYGLRGTLHIALGNYDKAIQDFDSLIELDPTDASNYGHRAVVRLLLQQWEQARSDFITASKMGLDVREFFRENFGSVPEFERGIGAALPSGVSSLVAE